MATDKENAMTDEWPPMAEREFDADGYAIPGTFPISVVSLGMWKAHGEPFPTVTSAGCAFCDRWAVDFYMAEKVVTDGKLNNRIERRSDSTLIYVCDQHVDNAVDELVEAYGSASNMTDHSLVDEVEKRRARR